MMLSVSLLSLAALAVATPLKFAKNIKARDVTVTSDDLANFEFYAQHAAAAYCNYDADAGSKITCSGGVCPTLESDGVTVVTSAVGSNTGIGVYVATDSVRNEVVVSVRGSNNVRNFIDDVIFDFVSCDLVSGCKVHDGFMSAWNEISGTVTSAVSSALGDNPSYSLVITGHSLGGAVATLAGAYLRANEGRTLNIYTYGSPRVGNAAFADFVTAQTNGEYRVTHLDDPVPELPPMIFGYRHTSPEYWLSDGTPITEDYSLSDIKVCVGDANVDCNASIVDFDIISHLFYFLAVSDCAPIAINWKRDDTTIALPSDVQERIKNWAAQDRKLVATLKANSTSS